VSGEALVSLARALSKLGWCSRAQAHVLISAGRVMVDGSVVRDPSLRVDVRRARIAVDGEAVRAQPRVYMMMHKPAGYVTTTADERGRRTVYRHNSLLGPQTTSYRSWKYTSSDSHDQQLYPHLVQVV
jgi:23S rRNA pseudouridine2605 synthase